MKRRAPALVCQADVWSQAAGLGGPERIRSVSQRESATSWDTRQIEESATPGLAGFNDAPAGTAEQELLSCCASPRWARQVAAGRPYRDLAQLLAAAGRAALTRANQAYEQRFGHVFLVFVFLVFATGRSDAELLAAARVRLRNDPITEREVVRTELGKIARLRLARLLE